MQVKAPNGPLTTDAIADMRNHIVTYIELIMPRTEVATDVFRAIADPTRRAILDRLRAGPANAGALAADFRSSRPAVSKHLRVLRNARLVIDTRVGRERLYAVDPIPLQQVAGWLEGYRLFWLDNLNRLKRNLEGT